MELIGTWINEYGSQMEITEIKDNTFKGKYSSTTGTTGSYNVIGCFNPFIQNGTIVVSLSISWNNLDSNGPQSQWDYSVSSMTGLLQKIGDRQLLIVTHVLVQSTIVSNNWQSSIIDKLTFVKQ